LFESPLFWPAYIKEDVLHVLDETLVPSKLKYIPVKNVKDAVSVIRNMKTRAFGQFLVVLNTFLLELTPDARSGVILPAPPLRGLRRGPGSQQAKDLNLFKHLQNVAQELNNSRPTFPFAEVTGIITGAAQKASANGADVSMVVTKTVQGFLAGIRARRLQRVREIADTLNDKDSVLTHCNVSGELAMAASLAVAQGKHIKFFATETRPYMQGAKLTVWELQQAKSPVTLVADNAVGSLMADRLVNKVIMGSDRSAANGDIANKIGSYQIAVLAREFGIPLIVLTQPSQGVASGDEMPIEIRDENEFLLFNGKRIFGPKVKGFYPGFDVVPHQLITKAIAIHAGL
jgi:methylthioribose-1-phosphate isomerase